MLSVYFTRRSRAVSPVIASILLITLIIAAGSSLTYFFGNINEGRGFDTSDTAIGANANKDDSFSLSLSLVKSSYDFFIFEDEGTKYYTRITISLDYSGSAAAPDFMYVMDVDLIVYGEKLDEKVPWEIVDAVDATPEFDNASNLIGYKQAKGTVATYVVELTDTTKVSSRVFFDTTFSYQAKVGSTAGIVEYLVENEEISKIKFNVIKYNVSIIHSGQNINDPNSGLGYWLDVVTQNNGSNKIFFLFDTNQDLYDVSAGDLAGLNLTAFAEQYQMVIFAEWAIQNQASTFATTLNGMGVPMIFGGTIVNILGNVDITATESVLGVTPISNLSEERISESSYQFNDTTSNLLLNIKGASEYPYAEVYGADAAVLAPNSDTEIYGTSKIELYANYFAWIFNNPVYMVDSLSLVSTPENITTGTGFTAALILHQEYASYAKIAMRNMLFYIFKEPERIILSEADMMIDNIATTYNGFNGINFVVTTTLFGGGDISANSLNMSLQMDAGIPWTNLNYNAKITIGAVIYDNVPYTIVEGVNFDRIDINIGVQSGLDIVNGSQIIIELARNGDFMDSSFSLLFWPGAAPWIFFYDWYSVDGGYGSVSGSV